LRTEPIKVETNTEIPVAWASLETPVTVPVAVIVPLFMMLPLNAVAEIETASAVLSPVEVTLAASVPLLLSPPEKAELVSTWMAHAQGEPLPPAEAVIVPELEIPPTISPPTKMPLTVLAGFAAEIVPAFVMPPLSVPLLATRTAVTVAVPILPLAVLVTLIALVLTATQGIVALLEKALPAVTVVEHVGMAYAFCAPAVAKRSAAKDDVASKRSVRIRPLINAPQGTSDRAVPENGANYGSGRISMQ
jgi:hypothetical protein